VSLFFLGYALAHIPAGLAAAAWGYKSVTVAGLALLATSTTLFAMSDYLWMFLISRALGGVGMSMVAAGALPLATAWANGRNVRLIVGGYVAGLGFAGGAFISLYLWNGVVEALGWRAATLVAAATGAAITVVGAMLIRAPGQMVGMNGGHFSLRGTVRCLRNRSMWAIGIGSVGAYGALFTGSSLGPSYAEGELGFSASTAGLMAALMLLLGMPGAIIGGMVSDRAKRLLPTLWIPSACLVALMALLPVSGEILIWLVLCAIGFFGQMYFSPAIASPAEYSEEIQPQDVGTALGLVLSLGNAGAILFPYLYAVTAESVSSDAGWWLISGISALAILGFFGAREPRRRHAIGAATGESADVGAR